MTGALFLSLSAFQLSAHQESTIYVYFATRKACFVQICLLKTQSGFCRLDTQLIKLIFLTHAFRAQLHQSFCPKYCYRHYNKNSICLFSSIYFSAIHLGSNIKMTLHNNENIESKLEIGYNGRYTSTHHSGRR